MGQGDNDDGRLQLGNALVGHDRDRESPRAVQTQRVAATRERGNDEEQRQQDDGAPRHPCVDLSADQPEERPEVCYHFVTYPILLE